MLELKIDIGQDKSFPDLTEGQISRLTRSIASRVRDAVIDATPVGDRPLKGRKRTKKSWTAIRKDEGGYSFENPTIQSWFLEYGSEAGSRPWPSAKSRTIYNEGRIYSSQAPEGITARANVAELADQIATELFQLLVEGKSLAKG
jgi:hypothetical protein